MKNFAGLLGRGQPQKWKDCIAETAESPKFFTTSDSIASTLIKASLKTAISYIAQSLGQNYSTDLAVNIFKFFYHTSSLHAVFKPFKR